MALALSAQNARRVAMALAPSAALHMGTKALTRRLSAETAGASKQSTAEPASVAGFMRSGAQRGLQAGEAAAAAVCGISFAAHAVAPRWATAHMPLPGLWGYALRGVVGTSLHAVGLHALDVAAAGNLRRLQLATLATLALAAVITEPTRLCTALVWAVVPACGALLGATFGLGAYCAYRLRDADVPRCGTLPP